jgi:hypothetical protein
VIVGLLLEHLKGALSSILVSLLLPQAPISTVYHQGRQIQLFGPVLQFVFRQRKGAARVGKVSRRRRLINEAGDEGRFQDLGTSSREKKKSRTGPWDRVRESLWLG